MKEKYKFSYFAHAKYYKVLRIMKISTFMLSLCIFTISAGDIFSQKTEVSLSLKNVTLKKAISEIEKSSDYVFLITDEAREELNNTTTIEAKQESISSILNDMLNNTNLDYSITGRQVSIYKASMTQNEVKVAGAKDTKPKTVKIHGSVTDNTGEPIIGATVIEQGNTSNGTVTDYDGNFSLNVAPGAIIDVTYIGYISHTIETTKKTTFNIVMLEDTRQLDDLVVVGYGTMKKVNLTGAVESIKGDVLENRPLRSAVDGLQGTISGLTVQSASGAPGESSTFKIRGETSLNSAGALVIVDGMPGNIDRLNPQDIESISVLKDAASAAIYGARAAEGVILVTTKKGTSDKTKIEYSGNLSFNTPTRLPKSNTALDHALLSNTAFTNAGLSVQFPQNAIEAIKNPSISALSTGNDWIYTENTDWIKMMMDHSFQQTHNLTVSRAAERVNYLFSANYLDQDGMFSEYGPDNFDMFNFRSNVNADILPELLNFDSKISYSNTKKQYHPKFGEWTIPYITFIQAGPNMPVYDPNGNYSRYRMQANPIQALKEGGQGDEKIQRLDGVFTLGLTPVKGLTLKAVGGVTFINNQTLEWRRAYGKYGPEGLLSMAAGQSGPNKINRSSATSRYLTGQLLADYNFKIDKHEFNTLLGWSAEHNYYEDLMAMRINIIGNELPSLKLGSTEGWTNDANANEWALLSGFARINYAYDSRYLFEFNIRADGSSRFSKQNKWGFFPSASVGWRITQESFMEDQNVFSDLKIRASYGQLGNQNGLGIYDHIPQYNIGGYYPFGSELSQWALMNNLPSSARTWETVEITNAALEMGFLNNRLNVVGEYYIKRNKDMLVNIEIPSMIGITVPTGNYGELQVKGWDFSIGWQDVVNDDFSYSAKFNISDQKDKLTNYGVEFAGFTAGVNKKVEGYSLGSIFGYETDGYFNTQEEVDNSAVINKSVVGVGDIKYIDQDGDGNISAPNDLKYLGTTSPRFVFGLNLNAKYKNIDISALFQGVGKRDFYLSSQVTAPYQNTWGNYSYTFHNDSWTPENRNALLPRHYAGSGHNTQISDHWLQNAAYIRLKNLQVGYTIPKNITKKIAIENFRIYLSGENIFEYSKLLKHFDPELTTVDGFMYPMTRKFSFGINVSF